MAGRAPAPRAVGLDRLLGGGAEGSARSVLGMGPRGLRGHAGLGRR
jgi:hypothetical protein